jgi:DMSO reductase anchor subunit
LFVGPMFGVETLSYSAHPVALPTMLFGLIGLQTLALVLSTMHLGRPHRFYRAFNNLRYSPVSREVAGIAVFYNFLSVFALLTGVPMFFEWLPQGVSGFIITASGWGATVSGIAAIYFMHSIYRIKARPFWNHWQTLSSFYGNMLVLGPLLVLIVYAITQQVMDTAWLDVVPALSLIIIVGLLLETTGLYFHAKYLVKAGGEGAASHYEQTTKFGKTCLLRNIGLVAGFIFLVWLSLSGFNGVQGVVAWIIAAAVITATAVISRALFYALVIPTTMPGAFFWRNKGFENHARETGLANFPQVGVLPDVH